MKTIGRGAVIFVGGVLVAAPVLAQGNFVTHQDSQAGAAPAQQRPTLEFSAPSYTPNAGEPQLVPMLDSPPVYQPHVPSYAAPTPQPVPQPPAPGYSAPLPQVAPTPLPPQPRYTAPSPQPPAPTFAAPQRQAAPTPPPPEPGYAAPVAQPSPPGFQPPSETEIRFREESETSRKLLAMEDRHAATIKALETKRQARKVDILDRFEEDAKDPEKVVGLAERLRAAMAELEELHKIAVAEEERRYTQARLDLLAASPSRVE